MVIKKEINNNTLYYDYNDKYKTISLGILIFSDFMKEHLSERSLIASLLAKSNEDYPKEKDFNIYCQELYDLGIVSRVSRVGRTSVWNFNVTIVNPLYLDGNMELFNQALDILYKCIIKPSFTNEKFEIEKRLYIEELEHIYNNKSQYAVQRFIKHMFEGELLSINSHGELEEAKKVTLDSTKEEYNRLITLPKVFYVMGGIDEETVVNAFSKYQFPVSSRSVYDMELLDRETKEITLVKEIVETQNISQSILCMGYRTDVLLDNPDSLAMSIFTGMMGHYFHSSLFQIIREELGLAYYVGSDYNARKGNFAITAAIASTSYDEVVKQVKKIIEDYQNGNFDDDILELTKIQLYSQFRKQEDALSNTVPNLYAEIAGLKLLTFEEKMESVRNITKEDIVKVANKLKLDTIYFLKGVEDEESN